MLKIINPIGVESEDQFQTGSRNIVLNILWCDVTSNMAEYDRRHISASGLRLVL